MRDNPWKRVNVILVIVVSMLGISWLDSPALAIDLDGIKITPSASYTGEYDDNVFRAPRGERRGDYINTLSLGVRAEASPEKRHAVSAGYIYNLLRYSNNNNLDAHRHNAFFNFVLNFNRAQFRLSEDFSRTNEFPTTELTQYIPHNTNLLGGGFDFDMAQIWGVGFDYTWEHNNYLDTSLDILDRNRHTLAPNLYYRLTAKTRVFAEYNFAREVYGFDKTRDNTEHRALIGIRGELTERFKLTLKGGWQGLFYTQGTFNDLNTVFAEVQADYQPVERFGVGLTLKNITEPATFGTAAGNGHYNALTAILAGIYKATPKISVIPRLTFGWNGYNQEAPNPSAGNALEKRDDFDFGAGAGIRWEPLKWTRLELNYDFTSRKSNFNQFEYLSNRVYFTIGAQL